MRYINRQMEFTGKPISTVEGHQCEGNFPIIDDSIDDEALKQMAKLYFSVADGKPIKVFFTRVDDNEK